jgi:hypothetical protein
VRLWFISQTVNGGYDTYDAAVVAAETEDAARNIEVGRGGTWCKPEHVNVLLIGTSAGVILASFNAG